MTFTISGTESEVNMSANSLPELVSQAQELLGQRLLLGRSAEN